MNNKIGGNSIYDGITLLRVNQEKNIHFSLSEDVDYETLVGMRIKVDAELGNHDKISDILKRFKGGLIIE